MSIRRTFFVGLLALVCVPIASKASGEPQWRVQGIQALALSSFDAVEISVSDSVSGGCMPSPSGVARAAEVQLRRNNFKVSNEAGLSVPTLAVSATGFMSTSKGGNQLGCSVHVGVKLIVYVEGLPYYYAVEHLSHLAGILRHDHHLSGAILVGGVGAEMQRRIEGVVRDAVDSLFLEQQRAKDLLEKHFPEQRKIAK